MFKLFLQYIATPTFSFVVIPAKAGIQFLRKHESLLCIILLLGAILRFWGIHWGLPYEYQSEEYKVIKYALRMGAGDLNPHFFEYPSLYLYFMLFLYGLYYLEWKFFSLFGSVDSFAHEYVRDPTPFYLIGRSAEVVFGIGVIFLTYYIGKRLVSKKVGLFASFTVAILPDFVNKAHLAKGDNAAILLGLLFWLFCLYVYKTGQKRWYLWAGIIFGLAISTKYYLLFMGITLPVAHFLSPAQIKHKNFIYSLLLIPLFFFLGSPFLLVEWKYLLNFFSANFYTGLYSSHQTIYPYRVWIAFKNLIRLSDFNFSFWIDSYGLGILSLSGLIFLLWSSFRRNLSRSIGKTESSLDESQSSRQYILLIAPILTYWLCIATYHNPAGSYMAPIFPLFLICAAFLLSPLPRGEGWGEGERREVTSKTYNIILLSFFLFSSLSALGASIQRSHYYTLEDTRTIAKKWIEVNIPSNSKILMDTLVNSPPLEMSREQLERFYQTSIAQKHYKKEYFRLKLDTLSRMKPAYQIFLIKRSAAEIGSLQQQVAEVQKTQDLITLEGTNSDFEHLHQLGIEYIIVNSSSETNALNQQTQNPHLARFYQEIPTHANLIQSFTPWSNLHPGPTIQIYQLQP